MMAPWSRQRQPWSVNCSLPGWITSFWRLRRHDFLHFVLCFEIRLLSWNSFSGLGWLPAPSTGAENMRTRNRVSIHQCLRGPNGCPDLKVFFFCYHDLSCIWYIYIYIYTWNPNDPCLIGKDLVLEGWPSKIEDKLVPGIYSLGDHPKYIKHLSGPRSLVSWIDVLRSLHAGFRCAREQVCNLSMQKGKVEELSSAPTKESPRTCLCCRKSPGQEVRIKGYVIKCFFFSPQEIPKYHK